MQIHKYLDLHPGSEKIICRECDTELCSAHENYKRYAAVHTAPIEEAGPKFYPVKEVLGYDPRMEIRRFYCPECGVLFGHEFALEDDPFLHDIDIDIDQL
jgi:acetone carboxylase gamma subunit